MSVFTSSLGRKIIASFLALDALLVAVGLAGLVTMAQLNTKVQEITTRNIVPMEHLRMAQNGDHGIVITGFAAGATPDPTVRAAMAESGAAYAKQVTTELSALTSTLPAELRPEADELTRSYEAFVAADEAFRADPTGPDAAARGTEASDLYQATEAQFAKVADLIAKDTTRSQAAVRSAYARAQVTTTVLLVTGLVLGIGLGLGLARSVRRRSAVVLAALAGMADGDLTATPPDLGADELGQMGRALDTGLASFRSALSEVNQSATTLAASAEGLSASATRTAESVEASARTVGGMSADAESVTSVVADAASNTGELGSSIREISANAQEAARIAGQAVGVVESTNATVSQLGNSSQEIGNVIQVIQSIAAQTSLLALNATIEAARAGEAGRGFAVVAGEVKELARETAEATESVIQRVQAIQADAEGAVLAIGGIGEIIGQINSYQSSIAAAVEEQSVTTESISGSVAHALTRTEAIARAVDDVGGVARGSTDAVASTRTLAHDVERMSGQLRHVVAEFRV